MPKGKTITRKDDPDKVKMYAKAGVATSKTPAKPPVRNDPIERKTGDKRDPEYGDYVIPPKKMAKGGNFIKDAIKKPGALRASLGAKPGKPIPAGKLAKAAKAPGKLGQRARFAEMLKGFKKK
jgi:hypothetical protein